jgi:farnesyl diphosphate synthase
LQNRIENFLKQTLPSDQTEPRHLHAAMRYSVLNGGKRIRPLLIYITGKMLGAKLDDLDFPAGAVELIHCYSLIHDDLPAMDNDDLRRGKPTCHKAYDEATAILAGDALQSLAFNLLLKASTLNPEIRLQMLATLTEACGSSGMAGGQALDLDAVGKTLSLQQLTQLHNLKTGALMTAAIKMATLVAQATRAQSEALNNFAKSIGLAFQIQDDILDLESPTEILGKPQGSDVIQNKPTYPELLGIENAKQEVKHLYLEAVENLKIFAKDANPLVILANFIINRKR